MMTEIIRTSEELVEMQLREEGLAFEQAHERLLAKQALQEENIEITKEDLQCLTN